jgi:AraC-like DNA-binding protein
MSIALIGEQLGFGVPANVSKFFKREVACTPREFRQRHVDAESVN